MTPKMTSHSEEEKRRREIEETLNGAEPIARASFWEAFSWLILFLILLGSLAYGLFKAVL